MGKLRAFKKGDGVYQVILNDNETVPNWLEGMEEIEPVQPTVDIEQERKTAMTALRAKRDSLMMGGVKVQGKWFKSDETERGNYLSIIELGRIAGKKSDDVLRQKWRTMETDSTGDVITANITAKLASEILVAGAQQWFEIDSSYTAHKDAIAKSDSPQTYDYSTGWPEVFSG